MNITIGTTRKGRTAIGGNGFGDYMDLPGDSSDYDLLQRAVEYAKDVEGLFCEIGTRRGGSLKYIIDGVTNTFSGSIRHLIAIDPYGDIDYIPGDNQIQRFDYTNEMKNESLPNIYNYVKGKPVNLAFFNLEDTEFFSRFDTGVPVYYLKKQIINKYAFVFFDGPHDHDSVMREIRFFDSRTNKGTVFVFDDVRAYDHASVHAFLLRNGYEVLEIGKKGRKVSYVKV